MSAIDVRHKVGVKALAVGLQRFGDHQRAQIGATDADVDHVGDLFAGAAAPHAGDDHVGELLHVGQFGAHIGHHVLVVHQDGIRAAVAQGRVEDGAVLRDVNVLAGEHGVPRGVNAAHLGQGEEQIPDLVIDTVLRVVQQYLAIVLGVQAQADKQTKNI